VWDGYRRGSRTTVSIEGLPAIACSMPLCGDTRGKSADADADAIQQVRERESATRQQVSQRERKRAVS
jgi:hypothetical protein